MFKSVFGRKVLKKYGWWEGMELGRHSGSKLFSANFEQDMLRTDPFSRVCPWPPEELEQGESLHQEQEASGKCYMCWGTGRYGFSICVWCKACNETLSSSYLHDGAILSEDSEIEASTEESGLAPGITAQPKGEVEESVLAPDLAAGRTAQAEGEVEESVLAPDLPSSHGAASRRPFMEKQLDSVGACSLLTALDSIPSPAKSTAMRSMVEYAGSIHEARNPLKSKLFPLTSEPQDSATPHNLDGPAFKKPRTSCESTGDVQNSCNTEESVNSAALSKIGPQCTQQENTQPDAAADNPRCCGMKVGDGVYVRNSNAKSALPPLKGIVVKVPMHRNDYWFRVRLSNGVEHSFRKNSLALITEAQESEDSLQEKIDADTFSGEAVIHENALQAAPKKIKSPATRESRHAQATLSLLQTLEVTTSRKLVPRNSILGGA